MTILSHLTTPSGAESLPIEIPDYPTSRSIIRRAKSAHGITAQHKATQFVGPDGGTYIHLKLHGSMATMLIELEPVEVEE